MQSLGRLQIHRNIRPLFRLRSEDKCVRTMRNRQHWKGKDYFLRRQKLAFCIRYCRIFRSNAKTQLNLKSTNNAEMCRRKDGACQTKIRPNAELLYHLKENYNADRNAYNSNNSQNNYGGRQKSKSFSSWDY